MMATHSGNTGLADMNFQHFPKIVRTRGDFSFVTAVMLIANGESPTQAAIKDVKERLNRDFEQHVRHDLKLEQYDALRGSDVYYGSYSLHTAKARLKDIAAFRKTGINLPVLDHLEALLKEAADLNDGIKAVKVVKQETKKEREARQDVIALTTNNELVRILYEPLAALKEEIESIILVQLRDNAEKTDRTFNEEQATKLAKDTAHQLVEIYVITNVRKLNAVIKDKKITKSSHRALLGSGGAVNGTLSFKFDDGSSFVVHTGTVHVYRNNKFFLRFPTTFHNVIGANGKPIKNVSQEKLALEF